MKHCVATYISDCARRLTSIWSMKVCHGESRRRVLTVEVLPRKKMVWQASGKNDSPPSAVAREMLDRWAKQEGLTLRERL